MLERDVGMNAGSWMGWLFLALMLNLIRILILNFFCVDVSYNNSDKPILGLCFSFTVICSFLENIYRPSLCNTFCVNSKYLPIGLHMSNQFSVTSSTQQNLVGETALHVAR